MSLLPSSLDDLTVEFSKLPSVGPKSAQRLAFHCATLSSAKVQRLTETLTRVAAELHPCARCYFFADEELCRVCQNPRRSSASLCIVEQPYDVLALERSGEYQGLYHVLGGSISPLDGVGPEQLHIPELLARLRQGTITEVILALDPDVEGDTTAYYLTEQIRPLGLRVSRLAQGLPAGGGLQYADDLTLARALSQRRAVDE
jgi:recombination protein RecR